MFFHQTTIPSFIRKLLPAGVCCEGPPTDHTVYLTFDDGPVEGVTDKVLSILASEKAKATFFCVGENVVRQPALFQELKKQGHLAANHTFSHLNGWKSPAKVYLDDIERCNKLTNSRLFRPPYGRITLNQYRQLSKHYNIILWSVLSGDYHHNMTPQQCASNVIQHVREGSIIVFHDSQKARNNVLEALPIVLNNLTAKGYRFETLESLIINN